MRGERFLRPNRDPFIAAMCRQAGPILVVAFVVVLAGRLIWLVHRYSVNIFFWDQWVFHNADLFQKHSLWEMFRWQFGPHRLGLGPWLSRLIEPHFHWNSRVPSYLACIVVTAAALCALWLKKRLFGAISVSDIVIPLVYLSANQYESLFINSNFAHGPLPLLLITLYCLAWTVPSLFVRYALVLILNFAIIYTGFGIFLGFLTPLLFAFDWWRNLRRVSKTGWYFGTAFLASCASIISFFIGYTLQPAVNCFSLKPQAPHLYLAYMTLMYANFWAKGTSFLAFAIGSAVVVWLLWSLTDSLRQMFKSDNFSWLRSSISATLISFSLLFALNASYGRLCLGLASAGASRYSNYLALGILGAYLNLLTLRSLKLRKILPVMAAVALLATVPIQSGDRNTMKFFSDVKRNWRSCYLAGHTIPECDKYAGFRIEPEPEAWLEQKLEYLKQNHDNLFAGD